MNEKTAATALRIAVLRENSQAAATRVAQRALDAARARLGAPRPPVPDQADARDGRGMAEAYESSARRAATMLEAGRVVTGHESRYEQSHTAWAQAAQRRQVLEETARRVNATERAERDRAEQRALDDASGRRRGRR